MQDMITRYYYILFADLRFRRIPVCTTRPPMDTALARAPRRMEKFMLALQKRPWLRPENYHSARLELRLRVQELKSDVVTRLASVCRAVPVIWNG